jgi:tetratricopeptide (TPR) repeat protein
MAKTSALAWAAVLGSVLTATPAAGQEAASRPAPDDVLAADSLCRGANHLKFLPDAPARQYRIRALSLMAADRCPESPQAHELLALIYRNHPDGAGLLAEALEKTLASRGGDFALEWQWLAARIERLHTAKERIAMLTRTMEDPARSTELRAEAAAQCGLILESEGSAQPARAMFARALAMDARNPIAMARTEPPPGQEDRAAEARRLLRLLECDPPNAGAGIEPGAATRMATMLDAAGLHEESLPFFEECWHAAVKSRKADRVAAMAVPYFNAMLNAGRFRQAVDLFAPREKDFAHSPDFRSLLAEAYQALGDAAGRARQVEAMAKLYPSGSAAGAMSASYAVELAMFHLVIQPRPPDALAQAHEALRSAGKDADEQRRVQRVLGAAELASGKADLAAAGEGRLKKLLGQDLYAAVFLADHYFAAKKESAGKETILAANPAVRSGPAFRRLRTLGKEHGLTLPPVKDADAIRAAAGEFDPGVLQMRTAPQRFLSVTLRPLDQAVRPGEPILLEAALSNTGKKPISVGPGGLFAPALALGAKLDPGPPKPFLNLPLLSWAAPRHLPGGQTVREVVRIDVGLLGAYLSRRPLDDIVIGIEGCLSPDASLNSQLPGVLVPGVAIRRVSLLGQFDRRQPEQATAAYNQALGGIINDLKGGQPADRMRAARQTALLLALARSAQPGQVAPPPDLEGKLNRPVLLRLMVNALQDPSEVVRAEMIAALQDVPLDESIVRYLGPPVIEDPSPLVRLRLVELMGAAGLSGPNSVVEVLTRDPNGRVRMMAEGFLQARETK